MPELVPYHSVGLSIPPWDSVGVISYMFLLFPTTSSGCFGRKPRPEMIRSFSSNLFHAEFLTSRRSFLVLPRGGLKAATTVSAPFWSLGRLIHKSCLIWTLQRMCSLCTSSAMEMDPKHHDDPFRVLVVLEFCCDFALQCNHRLKSRS